MNNAISNILDSVDCEYSMRIQKRDGRIVEFDESKISDAISKAFTSIGEKQNQVIAETLAAEVTRVLIERFRDLPTVEQIQDIVEDTLMLKGHTACARAYILFRDERSKRRDSLNRLMKTYRDILDNDVKGNDLLRDNANINCATAMGTMLKYGSEGTKHFNEQFVLNPKHAKAHKNGDIHIHDIDFLTMTTTCCQIDIKKLFKGGFSTGHGHVREPNDIASYAALACIAIQSNQNDQHGGQSIPNFDYALADGVRKTFITRFKLNFDRYIDAHKIECDISPIEYGLARVYLDMTDDDVHKLASLLVYEGENKEDIILALHYARKHATKETERATFQAMESLIHNLCTMHCLPAWEELWVWDDDRKEFLCLSMEQFHEMFEPNRYYVVSMNYETKKPEIKRVTHSMRKDKRRSLVTLITVDGRTVTVTSNHKCLTFKQDEIVDTLPSELDNIVSCDCLYDKEFNAMGEYLKSEVDTLNFPEYFIANKSIIAVKEFSNSGEAYVYDISVEDNENFMTAQGLFVHNSRAGAQVPFSSINYGTDTSPEGRMVIRNILLALEKGLGSGETPIFPIQVFRVKEGINFDPVDPNYDLFQLACRVSAKRLYPNFSFQDAPFNLALYDPNNNETEVSYMGCRTRVMANIYDPSYQSSYGRGNLSFTSINLPRLAILAKGDIDIFFESLDNMITLVIEQLLERFYIQASKTAKHFPFLMGQGIWKGSDNFGDDDKLEEILKHGTLSIGFIGLAECLTSLIGIHHAQSDDAQSLGLKIVGHMRERCDRESIARKMNFTLIATPAEGLSGRFVGMDKAVYGIILGVTDRDYYTNSFHVPVHYDITIARKIEIEAPYHALTNAGHITFVELDGDAVKNCEAFEKVIRHMQKSGIGYGAINHPVDRDPICGYTGVINDICPQCGRAEDDVPFERIRRITGYLVGTLERFNDAKRSEERNRVKHGKMS